MGNLLSGAASGGEQARQPRNLFNRFVWACKGNNVDVLRQLKNTRGEDAARVSENDADGFHTACQYGSVDIVREMLSWTGARRVNVRAHQDEAFRVACRCGKVEVVCLLLTLGEDRRVDVHACNDDAFVQACVWGRRGVVRKLLALDGDRRIDDATIIVGLKKNIFEQEKLEKRMFDMLLEAVVEEGRDMEGLEELFQHACDYKSIHAVSKLLTLTGAHRVCSVDSVDMAVRHHWRMCRRAWRHVVSPAALDAAATDTETGFAKLADELRDAAAREAEEAEGGTPTRDEEE